jgi:hypothetical protein
MTRSVSLAAAVIAMAIAALCLAGCGSANHLSKAQYRSHLSDDMRVFASVEPRFTRLTPSANLRVRIVLVDDAYNDVNRIIVDLGSIKPPPDAVKDNAVLVKEMRLIRHMAAQVRKDLLAGKNSDAKQAILSQLRAPETRAASLALEDLAKKGYFARQ